MGQDDANKGIQHIWPTVDIEHRPIYYQGAHGYYGKRLT